MNNTITRATMAVAATVGLLAFTANATSSTAETQFVARVESAFAARDSARLLALVYWDRVEPGMRQGIEQQFNNLMKLVPTKIELIPADPNEKYEYSRGGTTYRTNLAVTKQLRVAFEPGNEFNTTESRMPLGEMNGKIFITTAVPVAQGTGRNP
jgi:hypothetical protein